VGSFWWGSLKISPSAGKGFRNVEVGFDKALPPMVTLKPEFAFVER
jgi:hypothetical protein